MRMKAAGINYSPGLKKPQNKTARVGG